MPAILLTIILNKNILRWSVLTTVIAVVGLLIFKGPVYHLFDVSPHDNPVGEAMGIPMAIMANVLVTDQESMPEEPHAFMNSIADDSAWIEHYYLGEWDSCKWIFGGIDLLKDTPVQQLLRYTIIAIRANPDAAYQSLRANTMIVWSPIKTADYWVPEVYIEENTSGIESKPVKLFSMIESVLIRASLIFPFNIFCWNTGAQIIIIMTALLLARGKKYRDIAYLYAPLFIYDFGTMLLLSGPNQRYFYCNAVLFLPLSICALLERGDVICERQS